MTLWKTGDMKKKILGLLLLLLLGAAIVKYGSFGHLSDFDVGVAGDGNLDLALERIRQEQGLPALAAVLVRSGDVVEISAVGVRATGSVEPVTTDDLWHLGSITKSMTATLAAVLVEEGQINWDTTVGEIFPDLAGSIRREYVDVRLDELLSQTAGIPGDQKQVPSYPVFRSSVEPLPDHRRQWAAEMLALPPEASRGTHRYGNGSYIVAGAMLEAASGQRWEVLIQRKLFAPLNMTSTGFGPPGTVGEVPDEPRGHKHLNGTWHALQPHPTADNPPAIGPAGTVHATLDDCALYMAAHLAGARGKGGIVTVESFRKLHSPTPGNDYALGWSVPERRWAGGTALQHTGSNQVWFASLWVAPQRDFAMLAVTNAGGESARDGTDRAIRALIDRFNTAFE